MLYPAAFALVSVHISTNASLVSPTEPDWHRFKFLFKLCMTGTISPVAQCLAPGASMQQCVWYGGWFAPVLVIA